MDKLGVFVSHISEEAALAQAVQAQLTAEFPDRLNVFVSSDRNSIEAGTDWLAEIRTALQAASVVMVMCSRGSVARPWVNFEAGAGWIRETPLVPLCHSNLRPAQLPEPLLSLNGVYPGDPAGLQKLIDVVARRLGVDPPERDRSEFIALFKRLEQQYLAKLEAQGRISNPRVLCAASPQYSEIGFDKDVGLLRRYFGDRVEVVEDLTSRSLRDLLRKSRYDIVHLVTQVDRHNGDLVFSWINWNTGVREPPVDVLSSRGFADLLRRSGGTELVFLATCWSLFLGVDVARVTNMVATHVEILPEAVERWADCFYGALASGEHLYESADASIEQIPVPLRLIPHHDFAFSSGMTSAIRPQPAASRRR